MIHTVPCWTRNRRGRSLSRKDLKAGWRGGGTVVVVSLLFAHIFEPGGAAMVREALGAAVLQGALIPFATTGEGLASRSLRALGFWICYLTFSTLVGILALRRWWKSGEREVGR